MERREPGDAALPWLSWRTALAVALLLFSIGAVWIYLLERARGQPIDFPAAFIRQLPLTVPTMLLAPGIVWLAWRFPVRLHRPGSWIPAHVVGAVVMFIFHGVMSAAGMRWTVPDQVGEMGWLELFWSLFSGWLYLWILTYVAIVGAVHAYQYLMELRAEERVTDRLEARLLEAQLASLRGRLQPHFLFNTLQAVAGLVDEDPGAARSMLARLGDLLRASLETSRSQIVSLRREVAFVRNYLDIQSTRFGDRLTTSVDVPEGLLDARVPSFVLQPLVENALRHGVSPKTSPGRVEVAARRQGGSLVLCVRDDGGGESPDPPDTWDEGVGLTSTRQRLDGLYGDGYRMDVRARERGGVEVELRIPLGWQEAGQ